MKQRKRRKVYVKPVKPPRYKTVGGVDIHPCLYMGKIVATLNGVVMRNTTGEAIGYKSFPNVS